MKSSYKVRIPENIKVELYNNYILIQKDNIIIRKKKSKNILVYKFKNNLFFFLENENFTSIRNYLTIVFNLMWGLEKNFYKQLLLVGIGYKVQLEKDKLFFRLGFSHVVEYIIPQDIKIVNPKAQSLVICGYNLQKVTQIASELKKLKAPEPYKGKGICYMNEKLKLKDGKK
jgi:large subunit ribosomal protein L6